MLIHEHKLAYIIGTHPTLTTTFIDREIKTLREMGARIQLLSIRRPRPDVALSEKYGEMQKSIIYLLPADAIKLILAHLYFAVLQPLTYFRLLTFLFTRPHPNHGLQLKTLLHFGEGVYAAYLLRGRDWDQVHGHFLDRAATVALCVSRLLNVPYSLTAHAKDIYVNPVLLPEKLSGAKFVVTCTRYNEAHLARLEGAASNHRLKCIYHGLDVKDYRPDSGASSGKPVLMAVGQLKEKKGFTFLLKACRILKDRNYDIECQIVGDGPWREALEAQIRQLSLADTVRLCGALPHQEVVDKYKRATVFVVPSVLGADGDRDGIPNVILEAMAMQLPVVSTCHSGIPEVVEDGVNGMLVPPADASALADALARLLDDPDSRRRFGQRGRQTVVERFDVERNVTQLMAEFTNGRAA